MNNAFEILGLAPGLVFSEESLRDAYRETGKRTHPDAGGGEGEFAELREAFAILSSPSRRLSHWMELRGDPADSRGAIGAGMMDVFSEIGEITRQAESVIRKREEAKSMLVRAMLEGETLLARESVEKGIARLEDSIAGISGIFSALEKSAALDREAASQAVRDLAFLEKWRGGLRSCYARLV